jgi:LDH2 family malate/lactate/ureidoglycolate dehydrogenase
MISTERRIHNVPIFTADQLSRISARIFVAAGLPEESAARVGASLAESDLLGHESHGVIRIMPYLGYVRDGRLNPRAEVEVLRETPSTALLDAHRGVGQVAAERGIRMAMAKARQTGIGMVGIAHCAHIGRLGEYSMLAAREGLIGIIACNTGGVCVAPFGGTGRVLATNPISVAVPAGKHPPFWMDFATSVCAEGKLKVARAKGKPVPDGWILDKNGQPTNNALDFYDGGVILPWGGHKGYAMCLLLDILGGALTGHGCTSLPEYQGGNGVIAIAIDIEAFMPRGQFEDTVDRLFDSVKGSPPAPGVEEIFIPGEIEFRAKDVRDRDGIPVPDSVWQDILKEARQLGVEDDLLRIAAEDRQESRSAD